MAEEEGATTMGGRHDAELGQQRQRCETRDRVECDVDRESLRGLDCLRGHRDGGAMGEGRMVRGGMDAPTCRRMMRRASAVAGASAAPAFLGLAVPARAARAPRATCPPHPRGARRVEALYGRLWRHKTGRISARESRGASSWWRRVAGGGDGRGANAVGSVSRVATLPAAAAAAAAAAGAAGSANAAAAATPHPAAWHRAEPGGSVARAIPAGHSSQPAE
eukprot:361323-Chlamydomonas_euryale.AAC.15